jgi:hypothetical protein
MYTCIDMYRSQQAEAVMIIIIEQSIKKIDIIHYY